MENIKFIYKYISRTRNLYFLRSTLQGLLYLLIFISVSFFILVLADIAIHFNSTLLSIVHSTLFVLTLLLFIYYLGKPLYYWIINTSQYDQLWFARQIGNSDNTIDDKLTNILELHKENSSNELIQSSISQKLQLINISKIDSFFSFRILLKQIYLFLSILFVLSLMAFLNPDSFNYSSQRILPIISENKELSYTIEIDKSNLEVEKGKDYYVLAKVVGLHKPENLYIEIGGIQYFMNDSSNYFTYELTNIKQDVSFKLVNEFYSSENYTLKCIPIPILKNIKLNVDPPSYTNTESFSINGSGNVVFPYGSNLTWTINTIDTDSLYFFSDSLYAFNFNSISAFEFSKQYFNDFSYQLILQNIKGNKTDSVNFEAKVIPDQYPNIKLEEYKIDFLGNFIFKGEISDDYGFKSFDFVIQFGEERIVKNIPLISSNLNQIFQYKGSLRDFEELIKNQDVELFLQVKDNDPYYPYKSSFSSSLYGKLPNQNELSSLEDMKVSSLKDKLSLGTKLLEQLNREKVNIRKKLLSENASKWEKKQLSEQLQQSNEELKQLSEQINQLREDLKEFGKFDKQTDLLQKRQQLEELLDKLMDDELKSLMEELQKLQNEIMNDEMPKMDNAELSMDELEKHLDQNLEMLKRYEVEKKQEEVIEEIRKLANEFNDIDNPKSTEEIEDLKKQVDSTFQKHSDNIEQNKNLQDPLELSEFSKEKKEIQDQKDEINSSEDLQDPDKNPGDELDELANQMEMNMNMAMQQQQGEDAAMIRDLLENLLQFSFMQETYIDQFNNYEQFNLNKLKRKQINLEERFSTLEDSLNALMSRNAMVALSIGNQIKNIKFNFRAINKTFEAERFQTIQIYQQVIMQSANELILMLNESLDQMNSMSGMGGQCKKKGNKSKPGMNGMKKKQESMKKSLQQMIDQMKKGSQSGKGQKGMSEQLSKMLGEQEKLQQMLQQMMQSGEVGQTTRQLLQEINKMVDRNIDDIIKRNINDNLIRRQNQILNRMLEAEKAEEEREKDKKREAEQPNNYEISNPKDIFEYKEEQKSQKGILNKKKLPLKYFFQRKYDKYLNDVENN
ncbi:MAG: hypothetical protein C0599_01780 [Salinivirgaceae bacterium]|nr:MAG: hypothetical protein C0599_01780 [Salinivirgaceae bacterium]